MLGNKKWIYKIKTDLWKRMLKSLNLGLKVWFIKMKVARRSAIDSLKYPKSTKNSFQEATKANTRVSQ